MSEKRKRADYTEDFKNGMQLIWLLTRDNASIKCFFRSMKFGRLDHYCFVTRDDASKTEVLDYVTFYNAFQRHSMISYMNPMNFEQKHMKQAA